jgi:hypothetical protein
MKLRKFNTKASALMAMTSMTSVRNRRTDRKTSQRESSKLTIVATKKAKIAAALGPISDSATKKLSHSDMALTAATPQ